MSSHPGSEEVISESKYRTCRTLCMDTILDRKDRAQARFRQAASQKGAVNSRECETQKRVMR